MTPRDDTSSALAVTFSAVTAVRALPTAERDDPVEALDTVRAAIAGELCEALSVPAIAHLLAESAEWAWCGGFTALPAGIDRPEAAEMLRLTGAPGFATAADYAGLLVSNRALLDDGRDFAAAAVLLTLAILGSPASETE